MARLRRIIRLLLPCLLLVANGQAQSVAGEDMLLRTLRRQVDSLYHSFDKAADPVYFLSVRVENTDERHWLAAMGSDMGNTRECHARLSVQIRVGSEEVDNYYPLGDGSDEASLIGKVYDIPLDGNAAAVTKVLSQATAEAYREARTRYHRVLALLRDNSRPQELRGDFVLDPAVAYYEPPLNPFVREEALRQSLSTCTRAIVRTEAYECAADLRFLNVRSYVVASDGTSVVQNHPHTRLDVTLTATAEDGTPLSLPKRYEVSVPEELPMAEELARDVQSQELLLEEMRLSHAASPAICPVLFEEQAAAVCWQYALVPLVLQQNPPLETQVTPLGWQVFSDPTLRVSDQNILPSAYLYDDEGRKAEKVLLLDNGRLIGVPSALCSSRFFHLSNGHGRSLLGCCPTPAPANLVVSCQNALSAVALRTRLKQLIASQGVEFGYRVTTAILEETNPSIRSVVAWKVYADNRPDEPVYGLELTASPRLLLSHLEAGGSATSCVGLDCGGVSYHCCAPSTLIGEMEAQHSPPRKRTPVRPTLTYDPEKDEDGEDAAEVFFEAMNDNIQQTVGPSADKGYDDAFYVSHLITDAKQCCVESSVGSTVALCVRPVRNVSTCVLVGDDRFNNSDVEDPGMEKLPAALPLNNNYNHIRRVLRTQTDDAYEAAVRQYAGKEQACLLLSDSARAALSSENVRAQTQNITLRSMYGQIDPSKLESLANAVSSAFEGKPFLTASRVVVDAFQGAAFFCANDGARYEQPVNVLRVRMKAETIASDGTLLRDERERLFHDLSEIEDVAYLQALAAEMAESLQIWAEAPVWNGNGKGPVLLDGEAVAEVTAHTLVEDCHNLMASQPAIRLASTDEHPRLVGTNPLQNRIDCVLLSRTIDLDALDRKEKYNGIPLVGSSVIDADGVPVEDRTEVVRRGELISLLGGRSSSTNGNNAYGHRRLALCDGHLTVASGPGVLQMTCRNTLSDKQLYTMLRKRARAAGMRYGFVIHKTIKEDGSCKPLYISMIDVFTGKITPVRTTEHFLFSLSDFGQAEASSKEMRVSNRMVSPSVGTEARGKNIHSKEEVPCSFILPDKILFRTITY